MDKDNKPSLRLIVKQGVIPFFFPLLQKGVLIEARLGCNIRSFVHEQLGFSNEYIDQRIQTFFLDGKAVDDIDSALIPDRATLALSASMPGLLGATLRKGSYYAAMRSAISYTPAKTSPLPSRGMVTVKLFNLLISEMGAVILGRGVWVEGKDLQEFLSKRSKAFWSGCLEIAAWGNKTDPSGLAGITWEGMVFLKVREA
jgi:hypothetical protein